MKRILPYRLTALEDGAQQLCAPRVGVWSDLPQKGDQLAAGQRAGILRCGLYDWQLIVPEGVQGRVRTLHVDRVHAADVDWNMPLLDIEPVAAGGTEEATAAAGASRGLTLDAPTDGIFYSRPTPDAPPFAEVGATIQRGQTIGLIEVMKTFNQIAFDDVRLPEKIRVLGILITDGTEVRAGDPMFEIEAAE